MEDEKLALALQRTCALLGAKVGVRRVEPLQYEVRIKDFDYDMIRFIYPSSLSPGNEQNNRWSSAAAGTSRRRSTSPARTNPAVDAMIAALLAATSRDDFVPAVRALDRVLISGFYMIPLFHPPEDWWARWTPRRASRGAVALRRRADHLVGRGNERRRRSEPLAVDVVSDVVCPWCFIGKRRLEKAVAEAGAAARDQLAALPARSDHPAGGQGPPRLHGGEVRIAGDESARSTSGVAAVGAEVEGIPFAFDRIKVSPNTLDAHRLIRWAGEAGVARTKSSRRSSAPISSKAAISATATCWPISPPRTAWTATQSPRGSPRTRIATRCAQEIDAAQRIGVTGVPTFILAGRYGLVGAQPAEEIASALKTIAARRQDAETARPSRTTCRAATSRRRATLGDTI